MKFEIQMDIEGIAAQVQKVAARTIKRAIFRLQQVMLASFRTPKSGRWYRSRVLVKGARRGKQILSDATAWHRASAPGEAPAIDTGLLAGSLKPDTSNPLNATLTIGAEYAELLEYGSPGGQLKPRPFIHPAIRDVVEEINSGGVVAKLKEI